MPGPGNVPLQKRAGGNIGVVPALIPRFKNSLAECVPVPLGDIVLWNGPPKEGESRAFGNAIFYNYSGKAYDVSLYLVGADGKEFFVAGGTVSGGTNVNGPTDYLWINGLVNPVILIKGEKLIARVSTSFGYDGTGGFVQTDSAMLYQCQSNREDIVLNTVKLMVEPIIGKGLGAVFGPFPIILVNTDSIHHTVNIYFNDDDQGPDSLVIKEVDLVPNTPLQIPWQSLSFDQMLKAELLEPIQDAGAVVRWFSLFIEYDLGVVDSD